nr:hypothetical protein CFP56_00745 [Quercus suber]
MMVFGRVSVEEQRSGQPMTSSRSRTGCERMNANTAAGSGEKVRLSDDSADGEGSTLVVKKRSNWIKLELMPGHASQVDGELWSESKISMLSCAWKSVAVQVVVNDRQRTGRKSRSPRKLQACRSSGGQDEVCY